VALASGVVGVAVMVVGGRAFDGGATVGMLGVGHSLAYVVGALALGLGLRRRTGDSTWPSALVPSVLIVAPIAVACWLVGAWVEPQSRVLTALLVAGLGLGGIALYLVGLRVVRGQPLPMPRRSRARDLEPADAALEP
jgi:hypothetical protein